MRHMEKFNRRYVGSVLELTIEDVINSSVEDLIDQGERFTITKGSEEELEEIHHDK